MGAGPCPTFHAREAARPLRRQQHAQAGLPGGVMVGVLQRVTERDEYCGPHVEAGLDPRCNSNAVAVGSKSRAAKGVAQGR